jgi:cyclopropane fatty-acyl-phospholipid synthase-like methyltransferase
MNLAERSVNFVVAALKSYGPSSLKKYFWDKEFAGTKWDFINHTEGDCVYEFLEQYARGGKILDLGCGPGNTANEVAPNAYSHYVGVDISDSALAKARKRTAEEDRESKNTFIQSDIVSYTPGDKYDVILFRESMYHVPMGKIKSTLDRLSAYLKQDGAFVVRMFMADKNTGSQDKPRPLAMVDILETNFEVLEKKRYPGQRHPTVLVLRPRRAS